MLWWNHWSTNIRCKLSETSGSALVQFCPKNNCKNLKNSTPTTWITQDASRALEAEVNLINNVLDVSEQQSQFLRERALAILGPTRNDEAQEQPTDLTIDQFDVESRHQSMQLLTQYFDTLEVSSAPNNRTHHATLLKKVKEAIEYIKVLRVFCHHSLALLVVR